MHHGKFESPSRCEASRPCAFVITYQDLDVGHCVTVQQHAESRLQTLELSLS